jgi:hypothetical protein
MFYKSTKITFSLDFLNLLFLNQGLASYQVSQPVQMAENVCSTNNHRHQNYLLPGLLELAVFAQGLASYCKHPDLTHVPSLYKWQKMYVL